MTEQQSVLARRRGSTLSRRSILKGYLPQASTKHTAMAVEGVTDIRHARGLPVYTMGTASVQVCVWGPSSLKPCDPDTSRPELLAQAVTVQSHILSENAVICAIMLRWLILLIGPALGWLPISARADCPLPSCEARIHVYCNSLYIVFNSCKGNIMMGKALRAVAKLESRL